MYDVVTIGETMLRFSPEGYSRWDQADSLQIHIGGSESNTAVGLARLGMKVCWLSRLTDNDFGRRISRTIAAQGVDTQYVSWTDGDRVGTYYYEEGSPPRSSRVIYDRTASAFTQYTADQLPKQLFSRGNSKLLHITGISLALGKKTRERINEAVNQARQAGWLISFDVNYRARLWTSSGSEDPLTVLAELTDRRGGKLTVTTMGSERSAAKIRDEYCVEQIRPVPSVGRLGGGDAFSAGFLYGWLTYQNIQTAIKWASAAAAVKYSIPGDLPLFHKDEVTAEVSQIGDLSHFR